MTIAVAVALVRHVRWNGQASAKMPEWVLERVNTTWIDFLVQAPSILPRIVVGSHTKMAIEHIECEVAFAKPARCVRRAELRAILEALRSAIVPIVVVPDCQAAVIMVKEIISSRYFDEESDHAGDQGYV